MGKFFYETITKFSFPIFTHFSAKTITNTVEKLGLLVDPVIETITKLEFEDGLRTEVLHGGCWQPCGVRTWPKIKSNPPPHQVGSYSKFGSLMAFVELLKNIQIY